MFSVLATCFSCAKEATSRRKDVTFLVLGLDNAGKSTVCACLQNASTEDITPTIGFANGHVRLKGCNVTLLDLGGGERLREIWHNYYAETHGVVFVMDASDAAKITEAKEALVRVIGDQRIKGKPLLIFANKQDEASALSNQDICDRLGVEELIDNAGIDQCQVVACTALRRANSGSKVDRNIRRGAKWLLRCIMKEWDELSERIEADTTAQRESEAAERRERAERVRRIREEREAAAAAAEGGDPQGNSPMMQEPSPSPIIDVQQTNCSHPATNLESEPAIVITSASPLHTSGFDSTPAPEMGMGPEDSSESNQHGPPQNRTLEGEGRPSSTPTLPSSVSQERPVIISEETSAHMSLEDREPTKETQQSQACPAASRHLQDRGSAQQITKVTVATSLPSQSVAPQCLSSASSSSASSHSSAVRLEPIDIELLKSEKKKRRHFRGVKHNKVQPAGEGVPLEGKGPRLGWEEAPRRNSSGIIKLHSSRESLNDGQRAASDEDVLDILSPPPALESEVPSIAVQSPGLGDTQFLP